MKSSINAWEPSGTGSAPESGAAKAAGAAAGAEPGLAPTSAAQGETLERHGSWIISLAFHLALFIMLFHSQFRGAKSEAASEPIRIVLSADPAPPPPSVPAAGDNALAAPAQPAAPAPPPEMPSAPATTTADPKPSDEDALTKEVAGLALEAMKEQVSSAGLSDDGPEDTLKSPNPQEPDAPLGLPSSDPDAAPGEPAAMPAAGDATETPDGDQMLAPTADDRRREEEKFAKMLAGRTRGAVREKGSELAKRGSGEIADRLRKLSVGRSAKKWLTETEGVGEGVIRSLDVADAPADVAKSVLERYGIRILIKELDGTPDRYNFLNQAKTSGGTFDSKAGRGVYQVFSYSQQAISRMMQLELEAMRQRGYDPEKSRLVEVSFGVVNSTHGYDLGVKDLKAISMTEKQPEASNP